MLILYLFKIRWRLIVALCSALLLVQGCSSLRLGYTTAPTLAYWWLDRYVDFNEDQAPRVRAALADWFDWNRRTQLPIYAALLANMRTEVANNTTPAHACTWQTRWLQHAQTAFDEAAPKIAELMLTIDAEQIQNLEHRHVKVNAEFADDFQQPNPAKRAQAQLKRTVNRAEMLYGPLSDAQREQINATLAQSPFDADVWLAERKLRQQAVVAMLKQFSRERPTPAQALSTLRAQAKHVQESPREPYRRYAQRLSEFNCVLVASVHNTTTAAQRQVAAKKLAGWEADLRALAAGRTTALRQD
jgi:hypothetical protein